MRTVLIALLAALAFPAAALADTITVVPEPAGANCPAGGVKITVTPTPPPPPDPAPADQVSYVCSGPAGVDGQDGASGNDGLNGQDGKDGQDGFDGNDGSNGSNGSSGQDGTSTSSGSRAPSCGKASRVVTWRLPKRFRHVTSATVIVGGHRRTVTVTRGAVSVDLHGLACGSYPVVVQRRGLRPAVRVFTLRRNGKIARSTVVD